MKKIAFILVIILSWSCENDQEEIIKPEPAIVLTPQKRKIDRVIENNNLSEKLGFPKEFFDLENTRDFGTFHNNNLSIYLTKDAELNGFKSNDVALFFVNNKLVRIRYTLDQDIMEKLADSLKLQTSDKSSLKKITMNLADRIVLYSRAIDSIDNRNHYYLYEELPGYRKMLRGTAAIDPN